MTDEIEKIEKKIKELIEKRNKAIQEAQLIQKQLIVLDEQLKEKSGDYVKINCLSCGGVGYVTDPADKTKKIVCRSDELPLLCCNGKGFVWMKKYEG